MKRKNIGRVAGLAVASLALGGVMAQSAMAAAPDPAPYCSAFGKITQASTGGSVDIPDGTLVDPLNPLGPSTPGAVVSKTINISGATGTIRDLDVITNITHPINREVQITLSKGSKSILLVGARTKGRAGANGYNGTVWDDSAAKTVSEANTDLNTGTVGQPSLSPEGSLAAFIGDDPNGTWKLEVQDFAAADTGKLNGFSLAISTSGAGPATTTTTMQGTGGSIPEVPGTGVIERTVVVSGAPTYLTDVNLATSIEHNFDPSELTVRLVSPQGTSVLISNNRGTGSFRSLSTLWNDSASALITNATWTGGQTRPQMVPEGSLGAFIGQNPNGTWKLIVEDLVPKDVTNPDGVTLGNWSLDLTGTNGCPAPPVTPTDPTPPADPTPTAPTLVAPPAQIAAPPAPVCVRVGLNTKVLGATGIKKGKAGVVKVQLKNTGGASAGNATATFAIPGGFTVTKTPAGATIKRGKLTLPFGTIAAGKTKTVSLTLKAGAKASTGLRKSTVSASAACGSTGSGKLAVTIKKA